MSRFRTLLRAAPIAAAALFALASSSRRAIAEPAASDAAERNERCATRLFTAMVGESASREALASSNPVAWFDTLVNDPRFFDRFARFVNSELNPAPGATPAEDAAYYLAKHVLETNKPWSDMFLGPYDVSAAGENDEPVTASASSPRIASCRTRSG